MRRAVICFSAVAGLSGSISAQSPVLASSSGAVVAVPRLAPAAGATALPSNSEIWLTVDREVNSKRLREGAIFPLSVSRDVMLGDYVVIPRGTPARGQISYRTGKGAFGKSAKIEFDLTDIELPGRTISVTGHYRIEGQGNTGAAVGAVVAVGVFGAFVTGHSAVVSQGAEYRAFTREALPVVLATADAAPRAMTLPAAAPIIQPASVTREAVSSGSLRSRDDAIIVPMR